MIGALVFALCALTTLLCTVLLFSRYAKTRVRLLLWSALCFGGLTLNNAILFVDMVLVPDVSLFTVRLLIVAAGMCLLLFGMIWESE